MIILGPFLCFDIIGPPIIGPRGTNYVNINGPGGPPMFDTGVRVVSSRELPYVIL